jgi:hypothetical protein
MTILQLEAILNDYITSSKKFQIQKNIFLNEGGREIYNETIRQNVQANSFGIYIWVDAETQEVIYIGMAGKIKSSGALCSHTLCNRLTASRGKHKLTKKDILTNDYVKSYMEANNINIFNFCIYYTKEGEPPSYVEALLLYNFYKTNKRLPKLNNAF